MEVSNSITPWSVGKYAKRTATLHLGSEDQSSTTHSKLDFGGVLVLGYSRQARAANAARPNVTFMDLQTLETPERDGTPFFNVHPQHYLEIIGYGVAGGAASSATQLPLGSHYPISAVHPEEDFNVATRDEDIGPNLGLQSAFSTKSDCLAFNILNFLVPANGVLFGEEGSSAMSILRDPGVNPGNPGAADHVPPTDLSGVQVGDVVAVPLSANPVGKTIARSPGNYEFSRIVGVTTTGIAVDPPLESAHIEENNLFITRNAIVNIKQQGMTGFDTHVDYGVTVPNIIGYPEHKRCLMMVQEAWFYGGDSLFTNAMNGGVPADAASLGQFQTPPLVGVEISGVAPHKSFTSNIGGAGLTTQAHTINNSQIIGYGVLNPIGQRSSFNENETIETIDRNQRIAYGFKSDRSILDGGVLTSSPFGKGIRVRFINMTTGATLATAMSQFQDDDTTQTTFHFNANLAIEDNPTHVVLRMLFIDDDEMPDR